MRHLKKGKKFHRVRGARRSFLRNLANDLVRNGKIETTEARAKAIRPIVERYVTMAKKQTLAARRVLIARMQNQRLVGKLMTDVAPRYAERQGGYLRVVKLMKHRKRDAAPLAVIEWV